MGPDFSDLAERVDEVLSEWPRSAERREANREYVLEARSEDLLADHWAAALCGAVSVNLQRCKRGIAHLE